MWSVVGARAKQLENEAKEELAALPPGDTVAGRWNGEIIAKATMTKGGTKVVVTDEHALFSWVAKNYPTEITSYVNTAFLEVLKKRAKELGHAVDENGELIPGLEVVASDPYVTIRKEKHATELVGEMFARGELSLQSQREIEQ